MAPVDRRAAALDRAWDALARGEPAPVPEHEDAALTAFVARLQATSAIPTLFPDPEQGWRELRARDAAPTAATAMSATPSAPSRSPNGRPTTIDRITTPHSRQSPRWLLSQLATAALLLALAGGLFVLWQGQGRDREAATWLPPSIASSLPPGYAEEILFEATFAAEELPDGATEAAFYRVTLPPATGLPDLAATHCVHGSSSCIKDAVTKGVGAEIVEAGAYEIRLDRPIWVQRAGGLAGKEESPAGQGVVLYTDDVAVFHDYLATGEIRNPGSEPVEILGLAIVDYATGGELIPDFPPGITAEQLDVSIVSDWEALPDGPVTVTLRRVALPAQTLLPPFGPRGLESIRVERGSIAWTFARSAEAGADGLRIHRRAGETAPFAISPDGALRFLESTGDEPAELLVLTIEPAGLQGNPLLP